MFKVKFGPKVPININIHIVIACVHNSGQIVYRKSYYTLSLHRETSETERGKMATILCFGRFDPLVSPIMALFIRS